MIDKNELLKILPKLIREDDEIKGAIITALSGVVATKDDIARIIENSNRRFEEVNKRFESMDKRFESMDKRFESMDKRFEQAAKEREDIKESMIILRETVGEYMKKTENLEKDIKKGNKEIMDYLKTQFEEE
ncbi:MAG: hypothetical protein ACOC4M_07580 [Promethearchaeia archaeon]